MVGPTIQWRPQAGRRYPQDTQAGGVPVRRVDSVGTSGGVSFSGVSRARVVDTSSGQGSITRGGVTNAGGT